MKATIGRNYSGASCRRLLLSRVAEHWFLFADTVVSSCHVDTMPLAVAQAMSPRPRPPSPSERARVQKERCGLLPPFGSLCRFLTPPDSIDAGANPNTLTPKDAKILMEFSPGSPLMSGSPLMNSAFSSPRLDRRPSATESTTSIGKSRNAQQIPSQAVVAELTVVSVALVSGPGELPIELDFNPQHTPVSSSDQALLAWVNSNLPSTAPLAMDLGSSLSSGQLLVRLVENVSGRASGITDSEFDKYEAPTKPGQALNVAYFDTVFNGTLLLFHLRSCRAHSSSCQCSTSSRRSFPVRFSISRFVHNPI
jgi:hypothetical protein